MSTALYSSPAEPTAPLSPHSRDDHRSPRRASDAPRDWRYRARPASHAGGVPISDEELARIPRVAKTVLRALPFLTSEEGLTRATLETIRCRAWRGSPDRVYSLRSIQRGVSWLVSVGLLTEYFRARRVIESEDEEDPESWAPEPVSYRTTVEHEVWGTLMVDSVPRSAWRVPLETRDAIRALPRAGSGGARAGAGRPAGAPRRPRQGSLFEEPSSLPRKPSGGGRGGEGGDDGRGNQNGAEGIQNVRPIREAIEKRSDFFGKKSDPACAESENPPGVNGGGKIGSPAGVSAAPPLPSSSTKRAEPALQDKGADIPLPGLRLLQPRPAPSKSFIPLKQIPPYPGLDLIKAARVPEPPMVPEKATDEELVACLVKAYRTAVDYVYHDGRVGKCWTYRNGISPKDKLFAILAEDARALREEAISPVSWAVWSLQLWLKAKGPGPRGGKPKAPWITWVFASTRVIDKAGWFGSEMGTNLGGAVLISPSHEELLKRWATLRREVALCRDDGDAVIRELVEAAFPKGLYDVLLERARKESAAKQAEIRKQIKDGAFIW